MTASTANCSSASRVRRSASWKNQARHERETEQVAESKELLGRSVRVGVVLARPEHGVILEAVEDVDRLAWRARDRARREDGPLVGHVRVERKGPVVVAEMPRVEARKKRAFAHPEALPVG
jgi:hypothetical protein